MSQESNDISLGKGRLDCLLGHTFSLRVTDFNPALWFSFQNNFDFGGFGEPRTTLILSGYRQGFWKDSLTTREVQILFDPEFDRTITVINFQFIQVLLIWHIVLELIFKNIDASCAASSGVSGYDANGKFPCHFRFIFLNFVNVQNCSQKLFPKQYGMKEIKWEYCRNSTFSAAMKWQFVVKYDLDTQLYII